MEGVFIMFVCEFLVDWGSIDVVDDIVLLVVMLEVVLDISVEVFVFDEMVVWCVVKY